MLPQFGNAMNKLSRKGLAIGAAAAILTALRLRWSMLGAMLFSLLLAIIITYFPLRNHWQQDEIKRVEQETLALLRVNVETTTFPTVADTVKLGSRLMTLSLVMGGIVVNTLGDELGAFGVLPRLTLAEARRDSPIQRSQEDRYVDIFFEPSRSGLAFPLILRLDGTKIAAGVFRQANVMAMHVSVVVLVTFIILMAFLEYIVISPARALRDAAGAASANPRSADTFRLRWRRKDELGEAAVAVDVLLANLSLLHHDDMVMTNEAILRSGLSFLTYDDSGQLLNANRAALQFFAADDVDELATRSSSYLRIKEQNRWRHLTPIDLVNSSRFEANCDVLTPSGPKHCLVSIVSIPFRSKRATIHHMVTIVDVSDAMVHARQSEDDVKKMSGQIEDLHRRLSEQRQLFESCTIIMSTLQTDNTATPAIGQTTSLIAVDQLVESWCAEAVRNRLIAGRVLSGTLPTLHCHPVLFNTVIRQSLQAAYTASSWAKPAIGMAVRQDRAHMIFETFSAAPVGLPREAADDERQLALPIAILGLQRALAALGGRLIALPADGNPLSFTLPVEAAGAHLQITAA